MQRKLLMSVENEPLFYTQLVKYGVSYTKAVKVAQILASGKSERLLANEDRQLVKDTCRQWARLRQLHST
ncbi:hypothetical protein [Nostoc sp. MG11]|uniref:hypothetical protein n=1 Tax=Nostoc sp. MG11 TaxID=2721166 RepID=UPI0018674F16|nr:hypothetical protein [Nostoc sp. MG11]